MFLFLAFILIGLLWFYARSLSRTLEELRSTVWDQGAHLKEVDGHIHSLRPPAPIVPTPRVELAPKPAPKAPAPPPLPPTPRPKPIIPTPPVIEPMKISGGWEEHIGGNLLNKLGALVLVIGIALLLSYSFAHMGPAGIASTAIALSAATLAGGTMLERRERYRIFSRGLIAAGWAALYFCAYAIHTLPAAKIIESPVAGMILMVLVASGMVAHSLQYRVQSLTSLAYGCVFAALALSDQNNFVAIALIPLAGSLLFLTHRFQWYAMGLFGAAATYATFLTRPDLGAPLWKIQTMLVIFWLMFEVADLMRVNARRKERPMPGGLFALNAIAGVGASAAAWYKLAPDSMWQLCTAAAVFYLASTWIRFALQGQTLYQLSLTISAFLAGLAIFAGVPGIWISLAVMAEAELLFLVGRSLNLRFVRVLSLICFAAALLQLARRIGAAPFLIWDTSIDAWAPPLVILALVFYLNGCLSKHSRYFSFLASTFLAIVIGVELPWRYAGAAGLVYGVLLMELGIRRSLLDVRLQGYGLATLGAIGAAFSFVDPLQLRNPWVYAAGAAISLTFAIRATRSLTSLPETERQGLRIGGTMGTAVLAALLATRLTPEPYWGIAIIGVSLVLFELAWAKLPSEMLIGALVVNAAGFFGVLLDHAHEVNKRPTQPVWIAFVGTALAYYFLAARLLRDRHPHRAGIRVMAPWLGSAFALVSLWMLLPAEYVSIAFVALALLMAESGFAAKARHLVWLGRALSMVAAASLILLVFYPRETIVANCATVAAMQLVLLLRARKSPLAGIHGYAAALIIAGTIFSQVSGDMLTLSWSLESIGLLALGFATRERSLRFSGLAMLLICIGKVFFYDLRNLETFYRILSFIGLGAILLLVSWIYTRFKEQLRRYL